MLSYEEALKKAKELKPNADYCCEYKDAYAFCAESERYSFGGDGPVIIMKSDGRVLNDLAYQEITKEKDFEFKEFAI